jgi:hypothetical protein
MASEATTTQRLAPLTARASSPAILDGHQARVTSSRRGTTSGKRISVRFDDGTWSYLGHGEDGVLGLERPHLGRVATGAGVTTEPVGRNRRTIRTTSPLVTVRS